MLPGLLLAAATVEKTENAVAVIDFQSAVMLVMVVCLAFLARSVNRLAGQVEQLTARLTHGSSPGGAVPERTSGPPTGQPVSPSPEILAAITAAVFVACEQPVHILSVNEVAVDQARHWSMEGRRQIFTSHRVR